MSEPKIYRIRTVNSSSLKPEEQSKASGNVKVPLIQEKKKDGLFAPIRVPGTEENWISPAPERLALASEAHVARYENYTVPAETVEKILGKEEALPYPAFLEQAALNTYAELKSHLNVMKQALAECQDDQWVVLLSDRHNIDMDAAKQTLQNAPDDAGMIYLTGFNKYGGFGELPVEVEDRPDLVEPTRFYDGDASVAYKPDMLRAMIAALEKNLSLTAEQGGVSPLTHVSALIQRCNALGIKPEASQPEYAEVLGAFKETLGQSTYRIYAPPLGKGEKSILPIPRKIAQKVRETIWPVQVIEGKDKAIKVLDNLADLCVLTPAKGQERLTPSVFLDAAKVVAANAKSKDATQAIGAVVDEYVQPQKNQKMPSFGELLRKMQAAAAEHAPPEQRRAGGMGR